MSTETTATDVTVSDEVTVALAAQKAAVINLAVREARTKGWCEEFERVLAMVFPEGSGQPRGEWYDSDGRTCRGFDAEGFHTNGYNEAGYNRDGYDRGGYDVAGFNVAGLNRSGFNADGIHVASGKTREELLGVYKYNRNGYDVYGFNRDGHNRDGYTLDQLIAEGYHKYDADGYDVNGHDRYGDRRPN